MKTYSITSPGESESVLATAPIRLPMSNTAAVLSTSAGHQPNCVDLLQVTPVLVLIALRHPTQFGWWPALVLSTAAVLLIGNLMGAVASTLSDSPGEVMLYVFIPLLPLLYLSGVFTPLPQPALLAVSRLLPFTYLHESLVGALGGQPNLLAWETLLGGFGFLVGAAGLTGRLGRRVLESD